MALSQVVETCVRKREKRKAEKSKEGKNVYAAFIQISSRVGFRDDLNRIEFDDSITSKSALFYVADVFVTTAATIVNAQSNTNTALSSVKKAEVSSYDLAYFRFCSHCFKTKGSSMKIHKFRKKVLRPGHECRKFVQVIILELSLFVFLIKLFYCDRVVLAVVYVKFRRSSTTQAAGLTSLHK